MKLSTHFSLDEFTRSETALKKGIDNKPTSAQIENLKVTAEGFERIMQVLGHKPDLNSGFRSPALNAAVGGAMSSQHTKGEAGDATCAAFGTPRQCVVLLSERRDFVLFDQLILEHERWFHASFTTTPRGQVLTARRINGKTVYFKGIV
jgi:hypothetical protein